MIKTGIDPLDSYCEGVYNGDIDVCKWGKLAVERHYRDLERWGVGREQALERDAPFYFEPEACMHYVNFFEKELKHFDGVFAGKPIEFEPWQYFVWGSPFGWLETERVMDMPIRRFDEIIVLVPKKQGKSLVIAGTVLYLIDYDNYPGAQVYMLANNREQVKGLGYRDAEKMVEGSQNLSDRFRINKSAGDRGIYCDPMNSFVRPQTSKPETSDGLKVHGVANDEIKDWTDFEIYDTMRDGTSTDPNSLVINITTAGENTESLGYERQRYLEKILQQNVEDNRTFGIIYGIDEEDKENWDSLEVAKKANPNFGVSVPKSYYEDRIKKAKQSKRSKAVYLTKQLNDWGHSTSGWLNLERWDKCADRSLTMDDVNHLPCIVTVDLSSKIDLTEVKYTFFEGYEQENVKFWTFCNFYIPEARLKKADDQKSDAYREQLQEWEDQGWITLAGDETVDYSLIKDNIKEFWKQHDAVKLGFDPWNAQQTINDLQNDGLPVDDMVEYTQAGYKNWSEPMKQTEAMIFEGRITHNGNPVQRWCMGNVGVKEKHGDNENIRPVKITDGEKIDGAITLIMATGVHMYAVEEGDSNLSPAAQRAMAKKKAKA